MSYLKQVLVEQGELERLRQRQFKDYSPEIRSMVKLQEQMMQTLMRKDLDPQQKLHLLSGPQQRFEQLKLETNTLSGQTANKDADVPEAAVVTDQVTPQDKDTDGSTTPKQPTTDKTTTDADEFIDPALRGVSKNKKRRALRLLEKFTANPDIITRNDDNELVVNGKAIPGSDFNQLHRSLFHEASSPALTGMKEMMNAMRQIGVSSDEYNAKLIKSEYDSSAFKVGKDQELALGKRPQRTQVKSEPAVKKEATVKMEPTAAPSTSSKKKPKQKGKGLPPGVRPHILYVY